jgi:hypothetical protein
MIGLAIALLPLAYDLPSLVDSEYRQFAAGIIRLALLLASGALIFAARRHFSRRAEAVLAQSLSVASCSAPQSRPSATRKMLSFSGPGRAAASQLPRLAFPAEPQRRNSFLLPSRPSRPRG